MWWKLSSLSHWAVSWQDYFLKIWLKVAVTEWYICILNTYNIIYACMIIYLAFKKMLIYFWMCLAFVALCGLSLVVVSTSYQGVSTSVLSLSIRLQREGKLPSLWLTKLITWTTVLSNSMKLWAMLCRATQDRRVMVESSDKAWFPREGNGKPL